MTGYLTVGFTLPRKLETLVQRTPFCSIHCNFFTQLVLYNFISLMICLWFIECLLNLKHSAHATRRMSSTQQGGGKTGMQATDYNVGWNKTSLIIRAMQETT